MTLTPERSEAGSAPAPTVSVTIDGFEVQVPPGTLIIRAAERAGIAIPRFCDHPLLDPVGACRQCFVEVEGQSKPVASCTVAVAAGMVVRTHLTSAVAAKAQAGTIEFLLINHPLDCPICDKGGECPLQNQTMSNGAPESRFRDRKRVYPKPIALSTQVLLDRERCVLCARCTRFSSQIAGDPFIDLLERGALEQVGIADDVAFASYFSGNTVQICPVGALTGTAYRFRARPFDLVSTPTACEHCASGCAQRTDHRRGAVLRRLAGDDPEVNEEWNCDKGRWAFTWTSAPDRLSTPLVRDAAGRLVPTSWTEALRAAAAGLAGAGGAAGVLVGGRLGVEESYAYAKFARSVLRTNSVDFRARPHSEEEAAFLVNRVLGRGPGDPEAVTYADLEVAPTVLCVGFEPEEESPIVFLRLHKAVRAGGARVFTIAARASHGSAKLRARVHLAVPGTEPAVLRALTALPRGAAGAPVEESDGQRRWLAAYRAAGAGPLDGAWTDAELAAALRLPGSVILAGERLAVTPGAFAALEALGQASGARLAWIPRRAGERGALEAGALPGLLPGGHLCDDPAGRARVGAVWGTEPPVTPGLDTSAMLAAAARGELAALLVAGVDPDDLPDPAAARAGLAGAGFVVSIEVRESTVTALADVVLPVCPVTEKAGTFLDWEGRPRPYEQAIDPADGRTLSDLRVLEALARECGVPLGLPDPAAARAELAMLRRASAPWVAMPEPPEPAAPAPGPGQAVVASWHLLLDAGRLQDGEPYLAGTAKLAHAYLSPATAAELSLSEGDLVRVGGPRGTLVLPVRIAVMPDRVVWVPTNSAGCSLRRELGAGVGTLVALERVADGGGA